MSVGTIPAANSVSATRPLRDAGLRWYFAFFFLSGFCSILYELIWLRLAMAQFGVTTPMVSIVLSSFMAGLGIGSWGAGHLVRKYAERITFPPLQLYAVTELLIGCSAVVAPLELMAGRWVLEHLGKSWSLSSGGYYVTAGLWLAASLIPWCACMGATIPLAMFAIRRSAPASSSESFSYLYVANVFGALLGAGIPLLLIELWGFHRTLEFGMLMNAAICVMALRLGKRQESVAGNSRSLAALGMTKEESDNSAALTNTAEAPLSLGQMLGNGTLWLLFATGLTSMGMEVVWTRLYTVYVGTLVYSFALILAVYLAATFVGSKMYRKSLASGRERGGGRLIWLMVWLASLIPLLTADMRAGIPATWRVPLGIALFSGLLGFLTPKLVDRFSEGDPKQAGIAYAVNVAGCILGPLIAGFGLLPYLDERYALVVLALPWLMVGVGHAFSLREGKRVVAWPTAMAAAILTATAGLILFTQSYVQRFPETQVRRDSTATVIATGQGMDKQLLVNGVGMTVLTPITKVMASMPLAFLDRAPQNALAICFGMGTTHRTILAWGIDSTAVDLVPSVPAMFPYYHADAAEVLASPHSHVVIDDGRRFLERTSEQYDLIVIDPPPPIGAAGSSLLYSKEFYAAAKKRLQPDGILEQWYPGGDQATTSAITRALAESFPYVRAFGSLEGWGVHYMASRKPFPERSAAELAQRLPANAAADLVEWGPYSTAEQQFAAVLKNEIPIDWLMALDKNAPVLEDDRPVNEYGLLRHTRLWK